MKTLTILGSTGSIGVSTLDVVGRHPEQYRVHALVAGGNVDLLVQQVLKFRPRHVVTATEQTRESLTKRLAESGLPRAEWPDLRYGARGRVEAATDPEVDFVMSAIVGVAGLEATYEAICSGKRVGLANKEVLVASGQLVIEAARKSGTELIPVDSEHNGAHQCLRAGKRSEVSRLILTASGGPFRETSLEKLAAVTPAQALNHPTWKMGQRITIDSATLMNKGFEVIEACWLFDFTADEVDVVIHPQSTVHAMVEYTDGSVIAQISATDMRMPIQYALTYPGPGVRPGSKIGLEPGAKLEFPCARFRQIPRAEAGLPSPAARRICHLHPERRRRGGRGSVSAGGNYFSFDPRCHRRDFGARSGTETGIDPGSFGSGRAVPLGSAADRSRESTNRLRGARAGVRKSLICSFCKTFGGSWSSSGS